jgi:hypothetical protein
MTKPTIPNVNGQEVKDLTRSHKRWWVVADCPRLVFDHQNRTMGMPEHIFADAAEEKPLQAG